MISRAVCVSSHLNKKNLELKMKVNAEALQNFGEDRK